MSNDRDRRVYLNADKTSWMLVEKRNIVVFSEVTINGHRTMSRAVIPWHKLGPAKRRAEAEGNGRIPLKEFRRG